MENNAMETPDEKAFDEHVNEQASMPGSAEALLRKTDKKLTGEELREMSTSKLFDLINDPDTKDSVDENEFWKVILDRKPFWWFERSRTETATALDNHADHHKEVERRLNKRIDYLGNAMELLIEMMVDIEVKTDIETVMTLAGFEGLCP